EPMVVHVPDTHGRYYVMQMLDGWTNVFASPGKRTTGTRAGDFLVAGPTWKGTAPSGVRVLRSPTNTVWIINRIQTNGESDFPAVHALQRQYKITPLSAFRTAYSPPREVPVEPGVDTKTAPVDQVNRMNAAAFFGQLATLLGTNPPASADAPMLAKLKQI